MGPQDWYEPHKKNVVIALKKAKSVAKDEMVPCALVKLKDGSFRVCAGVAKNKMVMEAKKAGCTVVSEGGLHGEDGAPKFEVEKGDVSVKTKFAAAAAEVLGSPMNVNVVKATPVEDEKDEIPPAPPTKPKTSPSKPEAPAKSKEELALAARHEKLLPRAEKAYDDPKVGKDIKLKVSESQVFARKNDFVKAGKLLDDVENLLKQAIPPAPPPPKSGVKPKPEGGDANKGEAPKSKEEVALEARHEKLLPKAEKAYGDPAVGKDIKLKVSESHVFARKGEFAKADKLLDDVEELLKKVGGPAEPSPKSDSDASDEGDSEKNETEEEPKKEPSGPSANVETPPETPPQKPARPKADPEDQSAFFERQDEVMPVAKKAFDDPNVGKELKLKVSECNTMVRRGDFPAANKLLDEVEALLEKVPKIPKAPPLPPSGGKPKGPPKPPPRPPASKEEAEFRKRMEVVTPKALQAMKHPEVGKDIKLKLSEANMFVRKNDLTKAGECLDAIDELLKKAEAPGPADVDGPSANIPKAPPPPKSGTPAKDEGRYNKRQEELIPGAEKLTGDPIVGQDIKLKISEAKMFARKNDFTQACKILDELESLVKKVGAKETAGPS